MKTIPDFNFTFLDFPKLNLDADEFLSFFNSRECPILYKKQKDRNMPNPEILWSGITIYGGNVLSDSSDLSYPKNNEFGLWVNHKKEIDNKFPQIFKIIDKLPYKMIQRIQLWKQLTTIPPHRDSENAFPESLWPSKGSYLIRLMILNLNISEPTFYLYKDPTKPFYPEWNKSDSDTFIFNNDSIIHGALKNTEPKIIATIIGEIDEDKLSPMIEHSLKKYKELSFI